MCDWKLWGRGGVCGDDRDGKQKKPRTWLDSGMRGGAGFRRLNSVRPITSSTWVAHRDPPPPTHNTGDWLLLLDDEQLLLLQVTGAAQDFLQSATHRLRQRTSCKTRNRRYRSRRETPGSRSGALSSAAVAANCLSCATANANLAPLVTKFLHLIIWIIQIEYTVIFRFLIKVYLLLTSSITKLKEAQDHNQNQDQDQDQD